VSAPNPSTVGQPVTFTATVTSGGPVTTGSVTFREGATTLASGVALNASGQALFTTAGLTLGDHTGTADYSGATGLAPSSASTTQTVQPVPSADLVISLAAAPDPVPGRRPLTYAIGISNAGPTAASSVSVTHTWPAGATFVGASGSGWACVPAATSVTCTVASLGT